MACLLTNVISYWVQYPGQAAHEVEAEEFVHMLVGMKFFPHLLEGVRIWTETKERACFETTYWTQWWSGPRRIEQEVYAYLLHRMDVDPVGCEGLRVWLLRDGRLHRRIRRHRQRSGHGRRREAAEGGAEDSGWDARGGSEVTMPVSYEKSMRERALKDRKGLFTIEVINASKKPGKFGGKICMQSPANEEDYNAVLKFMLRLMKKRNARKPEPAT